MTHYNRFPLYAAGARSVQLTTSARPKFRPRRLYAAGTRSVHTPRLIFTEFGVVSVRNVCTAAPCTTTPDRTD
eukprot:89441-Hanusia_phi.AAC.1